MTLASCILFWSFLNGIDPALTTAVIQVESNTNPFALGTKKDSGLMQIRPMYVKYTQKQLFQSCTNVMVGTELLRKAKDSCKKCVDKTWVNAYNLGHAGAKRLKYPKKWRYYQKVTKAMK